MKNSQSCYEHFFFIHCTKCLELSWIGSWLVSTSLLVFVKFSFWPYKCPKMPQNRFNDPPLLRIKKKKLSDHAWRHPCIVYTTWCLWCFMSTNTCRHKHCLNTCSSSKINYSTRVHDMKQAVSRNLPGYIQHLLWFCALVALTTFFTVRSHGYERATQPVHHIRATLKVLYILANHPN